MAKIYGGVNQTAALEALAVYPLQTENKRKSPAILQNAQGGARMVFKSIFNQKLTSAFADSAEHTKAAAILWHTLTQLQKNKWRLLAQQRVASSKINAKISTANANRKVTTRNDSGFELFLQEYHTADHAKPKQPDDITRGQPVQITELLTGGDYEQRLTQALATSNGAINICVYQASANWDQNGVAKSLLFAKLLALPSSGRTCRLILAQPLPGTAALTFNAQARIDMTARGWQVRYAPPAPLLHAKFWLIHPFTSILGSHNLSNRAITSNIETSILINKPSIYADLLTKFNEVWANGT